MRLRLSSRNLSPNKNIYTGRYSQVLLELATYEIPVSRQVLSCKALTLDRTAL